MKKFTAKDHTTSKNAGFQAQTFSIEKVRAWVQMVFPNCTIDDVHEDGRAEKADVLITFEHDGKVSRYRIEVKVLHHKSKTRTSNEQYLSANGFPIKHGTPISEQMKRYLLKADYYFTYKLHDDDFDNAELLVLTRSEAYDYYIARLQGQFQKGKPDRIRICHGGAMKPDNVKKRYDSITAHGYTI